MTLQEQLSDLEDLIYGYGLSAGSPDLDVSGSVETGHIINTDNVNSGNLGLKGACCLFDGHCIETNSTDCSAQHGFFVGPGTHCQGQICYVYPSETVGACCCFGGACTVTSSLFCTLFGCFYAGDGTTCAGVSCPDHIPGACCCPDGCDGGGHQSDCGGLGCVFQLGGCSECGPTEPTGACCADPTSMCTVTTESGCAGLWHEGISCASVGSCEHDFCGPSGDYCTEQCDDGFHEPFNPDPHCCGSPSCAPGCTHLCACCFRPFGGFYQTCCCCLCPPPVGLNCEI